MIRSASVKSLNHVEVFEVSVRVAKYSCDSTINYKMSSYEALTSSDVLILMSTIDHLISLDFCVMIFLNKA